MEGKACDACGEPPIEGRKLLSCSRCKKAFYHDRECQRKHFKKHKLVCKQLELDSSPPSGIRVVDTKTAMGRVAVATKDFDNGSVVLIEKPAVVFDHNDGFLSLYDAYLKAPQKTQKDIMEMQVGSLQGDEDINGMIMNDLKRFPKKIEKNVAAKLVKIAFINAHSFLPEGTGNYSDEIQPRSALYTLGSKLEHSCAPNISFETTPSGELEYTAEMPIKKEERLKISYQSHVYEEARSQRRHGLMESKGFHCKCCRCLGYDECSPLDCDSCKNKGGVFQLGSDESWKCLACDWKGKCNESLANQMKDQESLSQKLDGMKLRLETKGFNPSMVMECCIIQNVVASKFSSLHWLHPKVYHSIRVVATSSARFLMKAKGMRQKDPPVFAMLQLAGRAGIEHFLWLSRIISIVNGDSELGPVCKKQVPVEILQDKVYSSKESIELFLDSFISSAVSSAIMNSQTASLVFHAGLDLLLAGHTKRIAKLFEVFQDSFYKWRILSQDNRKKIKTLVESKGKQNPFPNHILA